MLTQRKTKTAARALPARPPRPGLARRLACLLRGHRYVAIEPPVYQGGGWSLSERCTCCGARILS